MRKLIVLREETGESQIDIARLAGVSPQAVSAWECGKYTPSTKKLRKVASHFGVSMEYLLDDDSNNSAA